MPTKRFPLTETRATMARLKGVTRGAVSLACRPGGPLQPACVPGTLRIDRAHPAAQSWLAGGPRAPTAPRPLLVRETAQTIEQLARERGLPRAEFEVALRGPLASAVVPAGHVAAEDFAALAGVTLAEVERAAAAELAPAVVSSGRLDLVHPASLEYFAARPFGRKGPPAGYIAQACTGAAINVDHPVARVFLARARGRVPSDTDLAELEAQP